METFHLKTDILSNCFPTLSQRCSLGCSLPGQVLHKNMQLTAGLMDGISVVAIWDIHFLFCHFRKCGIMSLLIAIVIQSRQTITELDFVFSLDFKQKLMPTNLWKPHSKLSACPQAETNPSGSKSYSKTCDLSDLGGRKSGITYHLHSLLSTSLKVLDQEQSRVRLPPSWSPLQDYRWCWENTKSPLGFHSQVCCV